MTVKELIEMLETCDKESIVYINCGDDINSIDEIYDYSKAGSNRAGFIKFDD